MSAILKQNYILKASGVAIKATPFYKTSQSNRNSAGTVITLVATPYLKALNQEASKADLNTLLHKINALFFIID